jgi:hypothetical protein
MYTKEARTAYILLVHKNPGQVNKFVKQIISEKYSDVFIHIDKKNKRLISEIIKSPRVRILNESINVRWGDISMVDATLLLLKEVIDTGIKYDFVCLRSGQDMLVKKGFSEFLSQNNDRIFMNAYRVSKKEPHAAFAIFNWPKWARQIYITPFHPYRVLRRLIASLYGLGVNILPKKNHLPLNYNIYNGSNWFCLPLEVVEFILKFLKENKWYYNSFKNSLVPDEFFFQTLIMNSKFKVNVVNSNLMYIKFGESIKSRNNPITLRMEHIETILESNEYFARKFDENVDNTVIDHFSELVKL